MFPPPAHHRPAAAVRVGLARAAFVAALGLCAAAGDPASAAAAGASTAAAHSPPILVMPRLAPPSQAGGSSARLLDKAAARGGRLRVIVGIDHPLRDEDRLSATAAKAQQAGLAAAQAALLGRVLQAGTQAGGSAPAHHKASTFASIPYMALEADSAALRRLLADPAVVSVQEDVAVPPTLAQSVALVKADGAWGLGHTGRGFAVAILDTGVDSRHPMLARKLVSEACYSSTAIDVTRSLCPNGASASTSAGSGANCPATVAGCDHGTHVAGIAVGNTTGLRGVARDAGIISVKVFSRVDDPANCAPGPAPCTLAWFSDIVRGLERVYALRKSHKIAAANLSLGGGAYEAACDAQFPAVKAVVDNLRAAGIATVVASGNGGSDGTIGAPACISTAVAVGSTTKADALSAFSDHSPLVDLLAPGQSINSALPGRRYAYLSGTSMAAPHVAGAFAVLKQKAPSAGVDQIEAALEVLKQKAPSAGVDQIEAALEEQGVGVERAGVSRPRIDVLAAAGAVGATGGAAAQAVADADATPARRRAVAAARP